MSSSASSSPSSDSSSTKQRTMSGDSQSNDRSLLLRVKTEDGNDEVKIFSAAPILKQEVDDDVDVDGIEDRLSPVVEEPTSPTKAEPSTQTRPDLYPSPFLYPYFHPMWNPYLMAAAAQSQSQSQTQDLASDIKQSMPPYGAPSSSTFPGMPFPGLYPSPASFQPNLFNPFGIPIPTPGIRPPSSHRPDGSSSSSDRAPKDLNSLLEIKRPRKPHIKKPLNAFMIYMKEHRARVIEECTLKESSAINKVLGQKWKELPRSEQDRYYELAKEERNRHMQMYPGWSARDNYGIKKKRNTILPASQIPKKLLKENYRSPHKPSMQLDNDCSAQKKCRARYGLEGLSQWCKHCRRKKKCTRFLEDDQIGFNQGNNPSSSVSSPIQSDNDQSINDLDSDDILSRQLDSIDDEQDDSDEENHQRNPVKQQAAHFSSQFFPGFSY